ncbi:unannotated protein [freshwater metagenome]|uniref:Unannotated protein n=1 Tax=freshwater metagenome TaxID=449393 RepID=A0A6J6GZA2_9ZZZZ
MPGITIATSAPAVPKRRSTVPSSNAPANPPTPAVYIPASAARCGRNAAGTTPSIVTISDGPSAAAMADDSTNRASITPNTGISAPSTIATTLPPSSSEPVRTSRAGSSRNIRSPIGPNNRSASTAPNADTAKNTDRAPGPMSQRSSRKNSRNVEYGTTSTPNTACAARARRIVGMSSSRRTTSANRSAGTTTSAPAPPAAGPSDASIACRNGSSSLWPTPGSRSRDATSAASSDTTATARKTPRQVSPAHAVSTPTSSGATTLPMLTAAEYDVCTRTRARLGYQSISSGWCRTRTLPLDSPSITTTSSSPHGPTTNTASSVASVHMYAVTNEIDARHGRRCTIAAMGSVATEIASSLADSTAANAPFDMPSVRVISGPSTLSTNPNSSSTTTSDPTARSGYHPTPDELITSRSDSRRAPAPDASASPTDSA